MSSTDFSSKEDHARSIELAECGGDLSKMKDYRETWPTQVIVQGRYLDEAIEILNAMKELGK